MWNIWSYIKRWGAPVVRQFQSATPALVVLGVAFLLIGIWWLGPHWVWEGHQPLVELSMRVTASVVVLVVPLVLWSWVVRQRFRRLQAERSHEAALEADPCLPFVEAQERALNESLKTLRAHIHGRNALYQLPWYLVLGQEMAGKTSLVNRSNQNFSLSHVTQPGRPAYKDAQLAYSIDWWMGDEALLIDPPGEFITQPEPVEAATVQASADKTPAEEVDVEAPQPDEAKVSTQRALPPGLHPRLWSNLLDWLARNRSRRALNGVVVVVSLTDLLSQTSEQRHTLAERLRTRLYELSQQLGTRLPLYVVLSKFDLLEGFEECFARMPRSVREDLFGFTFTLDSVESFDAWLEELAARYDRFVARLNEQVFDALSEPHSLEQRDRLYSLLHQVSGMRNTLLSCLGKVLGSDRYTTPALVRGVYFSSVYQQGVMANAFIDAASKSYRLQALTKDSQPERRSVIFFAQRLFQQVIYPEAGLAGDNINVLANKRRMLMASSAVAVLGGLLMVGTWHHYFGINRDKAATVLAKSREFSAGDIDGRLDVTGRNLLGPLDQIRDAVAVYGDYRNAWPLVSDTGLYQGKAIGPKVDEAYLRLLSRRFLPALASGVVDAINAAPPGSNEQLAALRVYRMIEDRQNRRPAIVQEWMARQWQAAYPTEGQVQDALMVHLDYALKYADVDLPQHRTLIASVQQELRKIPLQQRVYMTLKQDAAYTLYAPLDLRNEIGPAFDIVYAAQVKGDEAGNGTTLAALLTAQGFKGYFEPNSQNVTELAMIDQWVLGERRDLDYSSHDTQVLAERIRSLYTADYVDSWRRGLNQLNVTDFSDLTQAVTVLEQVTGPAAPLRRLVETVRDNTVIYPPLVALEGQAPIEVERVLSGEPGREQAANIRRAFVTLTDLLNAKGENPSYFDETLRAVSAVYDYTKAVQDNPDRGKAALTTVLNRFALQGPDPLSNLQRIAGGLPEPLDRHVMTLADQSSQVLVIEALRELEKRWDAQVYSFYSQRLAGRYPFNPASSVDASLEDFEAFFGPKGRLQQFHDQYLKVFIKDNLQALYSPSRGGYLVRTDVLDQLEAANRIREAFFNNRGALSVQFNVEPLGLTPNRRSSVLGVDGQLIPYSHGPSSSIGLIWPNTLGEGSGSKITLVNGAGNSSSLAYQGPWSLFRLLSRGHLNGSTATSVDLSFKAGDGVMRYRVSAQKANNPFTQRSFSGFVLPRTLLQDSPKVLAERVEPQQVTIPL
jgi:type VI secretion system protein ImpL